jgi:hypothetical protein
MLRPSTIDKSALLALHMNCLIGQLKSIRITLSIFKDLHKEYKTSGCCISEIVESTDKILLKYEILNTIYCDRYNVTDYIDKLNNTIKLLEESLIKIHIL